MECINGDKLIAAHLGGFRLWDDVREYLVGTNILFDTAFISKFIEKDLCLDIIRSHGCEKILFGSDSPWENPKDTIAFIESLGLSNEEKEYIYYKNALKILS